MRQLLIGTISDGFLKGMWLILPAECVPCGEYSSLTSSDARN